MNPSSLREARTLAELTQNYAEKNKPNADMVIAAPFVYLNNLKSKIKLAAQNAFWEEKGAFTGEISPLMLKNLGVRYVIIGHSERRKYLCETDEIINKKIKAALSAGLKVILCVGEPQKSIKYQVVSIKKAKNFVKEQLKKALKGMAISYKLKAENLIIAYEPVWAIGTGRACPPKDALEMIKFIKNILKAKSYKLKAKVLYGGSVDSKNIKDFLQYREIDGALVGGASLKPQEVRKIIKSL